MRSDIVSAKLGKISDKIKLACTAEQLPETEDLMSMLSECGLTAEDIARALINRRISKEIKNIPEVKTVKYKKESANSSSKHTGTQGSKASRIDINVGRIHKIAPNFILGALVEATGMPGKSFGKIDIHDKHTTVEVPDSELEYIVKSLNHGKINGNRVTVKKYEGKLNPKNKKADNYRKNRNVKNIRKNPYKKK
jgi:ATP-dependent RNA helicase DeaD